MISPATWKTEACEHDYADSIKTQRLITHELVHERIAEVKNAIDKNEIPAGLDDFWTGN